MANGAVNITEAPAASANKKRSLNTTFGISKVPFLKKKNSTMGPDHRMTVGDEYNSDFNRLNHPAATPLSLGRVTRIKACFG
jgi:hypothetical protein